MNRTAAVLVLIGVFVAGISAGSGIAYVVLGPGIPSSIPLLSSGTPGGGQINEQFTKDYSSAGGQQLLKIALRNTGWSLLRSLNLPVYQADLLDRVEGVAFKSSYELTIPGRNGQTTDLSFDLNGDYYFDGPAKSEININKPSLDSLGNVVIKEQDQRALVMFPESNEFYTASNNELSQYKQTLPNQTLDDANVSKTTASMNGHAVYALDVNKGNREGTIFVSQSPPHTILRITTQGSGGGTPQTITVNYRNPDKRTQLKSLKISAPDDPNDYVGLEFNYDGDRLNTINGTASRSRAGIRNMTLDFNHGSRYSTGFEINFPNDPNVSLEGRWGFRDRMLSRARLNLAIPNGDKTFDASVELTDVNWPRQASSMSLSAPSEFTELNRNEVQRKIMPVVTQLMMKAMSAQRSISS